MRRPDHLTWLALIVLSLGLAATRLQASPQNPSDPKPKSGTTRSPAPPPADPDYPHQMSIPAGSGSIVLKAPPKILRGTLPTTRKKLHQVLSSMDPDILERIGQSGLVIILAP